MKYPGRAASLAHEPQPSNLPCVCHTSDMMSTFENYVGLVGKEGRGVPSSIFMQDHFAGEVIGGSGTKLFANISPELVRIVDAKDDKFIFEAEIEGNSIWHLTIRTKQGDANNVVKHPDLYAAMLLSHTLSYSARQGKQIARISHHHPGDPEQQLRDNYLAFTEALGDNDKPAQRAMRAAISQTPSYKMCAKLGYAKTSSINYLNIPGRGVVGYESYLGKALNVQDGDIHMKRGTGVLVPPQIDYSRMLPLKPPFNQEVIALLIQNPELRNQYIRPYMEFIMKDSQKYLLTHPQGIGYRAIMTSMGQDEVLIEQGLKTERAINVTEYDTVLSLGSEQNQRQIRMQRHEKYSPDIEGFAYGGVSNEASKGLGRILRSKKDVDSGLVPAVLVYDLSRFDQVDSYGHTLKDPSKSNEAIIALYPIFLP